MNTWRLVFNNLKLLLHCAFGSYVGLAITILLSFLLLIVSFDISTEPSRLLFFSVISSFIVGQLIFGILAHESFALLPGFSKAFSRTLFIVAFIIGVLPLITARFIENHALDLNFIALSLTTSAGIFLLIVLILGFTGRLSAWLSYAIIFLPFYIFNRDWPQISIPFGYHGTCLFSFLLLGVTSYLISRPWFLHVAVSHGARLRIYDGSQYSLLKMRRENEKQTLVHIDSFAETWTANYFHQMSELSASSAGKRLHLARIYLSIGRMNFQLVKKAVSPFLIWLLISGVLEYQNKDNSSLLHSPTLLFFICIIFIFGWISLTNPAEYIFSLPFSREQKLQAFIRSLSYRVIIPFVLTSVCLSISQRFIHEYSWPNIGIILLVALSITLTWLFSFETKPRMRSNSWSYDWLVFALIVSSILALASLSVTSTVTRVALLIPILLCSVVAFGDVLRFYRQGDLDS